MLPVLRTKLKGVSSKNVSLQDILRSCDEATTVTDVTEHYAGIHNTKLTLLLKDGEERVQFYNRIDVKNVIPSNFSFFGNIQLDIQRLNLLGCDFNDDDLEFVDDYIVAKADSLGYYGQSTEKVKPVIIFDNYDGLMSTETGLLTYTLERGGIETSKVWSVDDETRLSINPVTGEFTGLLPGLVTVTLTINEFIVGTKTFEVHPYVSIVAPTNLTVTTV